MRESPKKQMFMHLKALLLSKLLQLFGSLTDQSPKRNKNKRRQFCLNTYISETKSKKQIKGKGTMSIKLDTTFIISNH